MEQLAVGQQGRGGCLQGDIKWVKVEPLVIVRMYHGGSGLQNSGCILKVLAGSECQTFCRRCVASSQLFLGLMDTS